MIKSVLLLFLFIFYFYLPTLSLTVVKYFCCDSSHHFVNGSLTFMALEWIHLQLTCVGWSNIISMAMSVVCAVWISVFAAFTVWNVVFDVFVSKLILLFSFSWSFTDTHT